MLPLRSEHIKTLSKAVHYPHSGPQFNSDHYCSHFNETQSSKYAVNRDLYSSSQNVMSGDVTFDKVTKNEKYSPWCLFPTHQILRW